MVWEATQNYYNPLVRISSDKITIPIQPLSEEESIKILNDKMLKNGELAGNVSIREETWLDILRITETKQKQNRREG